MLGIDDYEDIDAYAYDSPSIIQDLNEPVPETLRDRFKLTIDGGRSNTSSTSVIVSRTWSR